MDINFNEVNMIFKMASEIEENRGLTNDEVTVLKSLFNQCSDKEKGNLWYDGYRARLRMDEITK